MVTERPIGRLAEQRFASAAISRRIKRILKPRWAVAVLVGLGVATSAAPASAATPDQRLAFRGAVTVGGDGNGVTAATFDASSRPNVRYGLLIENGCRRESGPRRQPCPPAVSVLSVTLNGQTLLAFRGAVTVGRKVLLALQETTQMESRRR